MTDYPDFSPNNYQIISELGRNNLGGRVTYLAEQTTTKQQVVIKQFQFALRGASWAEYDAYEQEIAMLRHLDRPGIPKYLDSFQTADGFCMVQEYINAQSLAVSRSWSPIEIKKVAVATLEILVYLQSLNPSVIHRDIKPENILADKNLNIYLVDFGFARLGGGEIAASSVVKGTMGFMPPEQLFNRQLTTASDLYGLGATLICLLTGTPSGSLGNLIDENYQIKFQHLVPPLKQGLISWLEKISQPNSKQRYANAVEALKVLKSLDVDRLPKVRVSKNQLEIFGKDFGEKVTETIAISNPIPETMLTGRWEVMPHPNDPPHTPYDHAWIEFDSYQFEGNEVESKITVNSSKLLAGESYQRELLLHSNSEGESLVIPVEVKTATLAKPKYYNFILTGIVVPLLLIIPGFPFLPTIERILKVNAEKKGVNVLLPVIFSVILFAPFLLTIFFLLESDLAEIYSNQVLLIALFLMAIAVDVGASMGTNSHLERRWNSLVSFLQSNPKNFAFLIGAIILLLFIYPKDFALVLLLILPWVLTILASFAWYFIQGLVGYQNQNFLQINATKHIVAFGGFSVSLILGFLLADKFELVTSISQLFFMERVLIAVAAIAPILFFGSSLAKTAVERWRAIARYNREKPNLIKP